MTRTMKWIIALAVIAFVFVNPILRKIFLYILPLGSGVDDFIEVVVIVALVFLVLSKKWVEWNMSATIREVNQIPKLKQVVWLAIAVIAWLLFTGAGSQIYNLVFFGKPIYDDSIGITFGITAGLVIIGWSVISLVEKPKRKQRRKSE